VRRTVIDIAAFPVYLEVLHARTWCSGTGSRWAERRIELRGEGAGSVDTATLWVHLDPRTMQTTVLPARFYEVYGEAAGGRVVRAALHHDALPADVGAARSFPLRFTDFDVLGHMNNANYWVAVEEELAGRRDLRAPLRAEIEHRRAVEPGDEVEVHVRHGEQMVELWLVERGTRRVYASAVVHSAGDSTSNRQPQPAEDSDGG
jgi:acyl-ACP thioesterase